MTPFVPVLAAIVMTSALSGADSYVPSKTHPTGGSKSSHRSMCAKLCKQSHGAYSVVGRVAYYSGRPFCWCKR